MTILNRTTPERMDMKSTISMDLWGNIEENTRICDNNTFTRNQNCDKISQM